MKKIFAAATLAATMSVSSAEAAPVDIDIMFVIDQSGSMSNEFSTLAANISVFINGLTASSDVNSVATGLVTYEDASLGTTGNCGSGACLAMVQSITTNYSDTASALAAEAGGTFGGTEDALAAVASVLPGGELFNSAMWRNDTVKSVVLITDEDADDENSYSNAFGTGYAALGALLDDVNYLNNIITETSLFDDYELASRPIGNVGDYTALFDIDDFTGSGADPEAFFAQFAAAKLNEITTGGTPTGGSPSTVPLPAAAWMLLAGLGGLVAMGRRKTA